MKRKLKLVFPVLVLGGLLSGTRLSANAQETAQQPAPDNTKINQRDRNSTDPTADQQKENASDRHIAQQIRQSVVKDKTLSTYAHNIKIISQGGKVTLKGPVRSEEEKEAIEVKAAAVVGQENLTSELQVTPKE
jgi:hyperosmotically inducible protein